MLPAVDDLLAGLRVVALPMVTRFRGITIREAPSSRARPAGPSSRPSPSTATRRPPRGSPRRSTSAGLPTPTSLRDRIPVNATVPALEAEGVAGVLARFPGCRTAKVKVAEPGGRLADDVARVRAARRVLGPEGRIRIDANAAWNVDEAEHALRALSPFDLEYAEQPCARLDELAELRDRIQDLAIPIAADESVRKAEDPLAVTRAGAADVLVVKAAPLGGVRRALELVAEAGCRRSCRARSTRRSAWRWARTSRRRCPSCPTTAGSARRRCSPPT